MKTLDYIQLDEKKVENVINGLQQLLSDFQIYYTNLRSFHWNIKGHSFFMLHSKFEEMYNDAAETVDELAERILMLGGIPNHRYSDYLKISRIKESKYIDNADKALTNIEETFRHFISEEHKLLSVASEASDEVTVSMMSDLLKKQEKMIWMIRAYTSL
ncbi:DNA starvation/stationary phase protection protein [Barnesiella propionica]|uniref:Dps family protein n=1 Tax=Barnesiella propionica TaxID=2981781 RepID=UPI0011CA6E69|nr:DNA starvation/stationary phase protection protein [Barnesiella propionica]MCU6767452.1 DNA starvation/stationary phase protection protein [Barnesiella propionica]